MYQNSSRLICFLSKKNSVKYFKRKKSNVSAGNNWQSVIGLEVHAQISSNTKLFSAAPTEFSSPVNTNVSFFDAAIPGTLPVLNKVCVQSGVLTALALSCKLNAVSFFDRKHYFYADLPTGYQITQQRLPLAVLGELKFPVYTPGVHKNPYTKSVKIKQIQLEQDSGKSLHDIENSYSLVDLNRAGIPLMEIVFEPDLTDGEEAAALIKELTLILQRLGTCSCKMEEGALRVDANISVNLPGEPLGVRSEVKNIGSIRGVASAIKFEIARQISVLESGGTIINETRSWDAQEKRTVAMRDKETVQDYRYMPEPNLPPLHLNMGLNLENNSSTVNVKEVEGSMSELPEATRTRLCNEHKITPQHAIILVNNSILLDYFNRITEDKTIDSKLVVNVLANELLTLAHKHKISVESINIPMEHLRELISLLQSKTINLLTAQKILEEIMNGDCRSPNRITEENNWTLIKDESSIRQLCEEVISSNPKIVQKYLNGKTKVFAALLGKVAASSKDRANMAEVTSMLKELLEEKIKNKDK